MPRTRKKSNLAAARARMYHELIFDCAERVFAEQGFDESTMQDVAAEAGVSLKTLYATFPGKDDIYRAILEVRSQGLLDASVSADPERPALEILAEGMHGIVAYFIEHPDFFRILTREGSAWGLHPRGHAGQKGALAGAQLVTQVVEQGMKEGVFLAADPRLATASVTALLQVQLAVLLEDDAEPTAVADQILVYLRRLLCGNDGEPGATERAA
ncbi:MAG: hypothetical protein CL910_17855 [Deltaproteobacteria bacterium]|jgi:AcrR family transcriptional regulator|nr:hypothetical protein [Deltaproteobacteria bacterium]